MKKSTLISIVNSVASMAAVIGADLIETLTEKADILEEKAVNAKLRDAWFCKFDSLPSSYNITTKISEHETVTKSTSVGVLLTDAEGETTMVATVNHDVDGSIYYEGRNIFTSATKRIDPYKDKVTVIYTGSIENCWIRWYDFEKKNLK